MDNPPLISVIIPAYNAEKYLVEALQSVIDQSYEPMEIIVIDDGSTDRTAEVVADFGAEFQYIYQENSGPAAARNRGLELAAGDIVGFIDADDLWVKNKIELQLPYLLEDPTIDIVLGSIQRFGQLALRHNEKDLEDLSRPKTCYSFGAALIRKSVFNKVGILDLEMKLHEDTNWFIQARDLDANIFLHDDVVLQYRIHITNISYDREIGYSYLLNALQKSINRRRKKRK